MFLRIVDWIVRLWGLNLLCLAALGLLQPGFMFSDGAEDPGRLEVLPRVFLIGVVGTILILPARMVVVGKRRRLISAVAVAAIPAMLFVYPGPKRLSSIGLWVSIVGLYAAPCAVRLALWSRELGPQIQRPGAD